MNAIDVELKRLLTQARESGRTLKDITDAADVGYFRVYNWLNDRTPSLDFVIADRVFKVLTGRSYGK